jgi:hypothetical protein
VDLADIQSLFFQLTCAEPAVAATPLAALEALSASGPVPGRRGLELYASGVRAKLAECLVIPYPKVLAVLGRPAFLAAFDVYRRERGAGASVEALIDGFPAFLAHHLPQARADLEALARLERARLHASRAPGGEPVSPGALARVPPAQWGRTGLRLLPSLALLPLPFDVSEAWQALDDESEPTPPTAVPTVFAVWRSGFVVYHARLEGVEARALDVALRGGSLADVCAAFHGRRQPADDAFAVLHGWMEDGLVSDVQPLPSDVLPEVNP